MSDYFDRVVQKATITPESDEPEQPIETAAENEQAAASGEAGGYTPANVKATAKDLLKYGLLEADRKPNLYQVAVTQTTAINRILEPFDLRLKIDDIRGLAFLVVSEQLFQEGGENNDEWSHPLVRRQRLTMEQSLLLAILRQHFIAHEQEAGLGAGEAAVELDELLPQLQLYLGDTGSDTRDQKRLRGLMDNLKNHGIVSDIDANDQIIIRPIITHLANPENLQNLLHHFRQMAGQSVTPDDDGDDA
ncbi:DUF4194 domain-containing protein [Marinobacter sp.]|uniref:DUF4194 domain-containing protein n=1 Tax=Marinobacter sp. TaxID=50741 RepID=UPI003A8E6E20